MADIVKSGAFDRWLTRLRDVKGRAIVLARIDRLADGNPGDVGPVGAGVSELRIAFGPGYRVYFKNVAGVTLLLLAGGDKASQAADIEKAKTIAKQWENENA